MKVISKLGAALSKLEKALNVVASLSIMCMMLLITLDTLMRYLFRHPISGVTEVVSYYLSVILVYLSISYCYKRGGHVKVTIIEEHMPPVIMRVINVVMGLASTAFFVLVGIMNIRSMRIAFINHTVPGGVVATPVWPGYLILVIGTFLLAFRILLNTVLVALGKKDDNITPEGEN